MPVIARRDGAETTIERHENHTHITTVNRQGDERCTTLWDDGVAETHTHPGDAGTGKIKATHRYVMRHGTLFCLTHDGMCEAPGEAAH